MKTIKWLSFIGLVIMLVLTSCSMEKRVYMAGYHPEWSNAKHNKHNGQYKNCSLCQSKDNSQHLGTTAAPTIELQSTQLGITEDNIVIADKNTEMLASVDNEHKIIFPTFLYN